MSEHHQDAAWRWLGTPLLAALLVLAIIGDGYLMHASQPAQPVEATPSAHVAAAPTIAPQPALAATSSAPTAFATPAAPAAASAPLIPPPAATQAAAAPTSTGARVPTPQVAAPLAPSRPVRLEAAITAGKALCNVVAEENGKTIYVTDDGTEQLLQIDVTTRRLTKSFDLKDSLCSMALDAASKTVYIPTWRRKAGGGFDSSEIQAVHLATGALGRFPAALFPAGPFLDPASHLLYAANTATPSLVALNTATGSVTDSVAIPAKANRMATSTANGDLYVASPDANKVYVLDLASRRVVATLDAGTHPWDVAEDPRTGRIFVSAEL